MPQFVAVSQNGCPLARCQCSDEGQAAVTFSLMLSEDEFKSIYELWEKNEFKIKEE